MLYSSRILCLLHIATFVSSISIPNTKTLDLLFGNCDQISDMLYVDYDSLISRAAYKFQFITLTHFVNNEKFVYKLPNAHEEILASSKYDRNLPMVIYIHGYTGDTLFFIEHLIIKKALIQNAKANVFILDAGVFFNAIYYETVTNVKILGEKLGTLLADLYSDGITDFHLIGHSLGAHVSSFAGKTFKTLTSVELDRITGLDPAGPCFYNVPSDQRLTATDAKFVAVIHTNSHVYGINKSTGHVDFYPNGGHMMPGCFEFVCSHSRSIYYMSESVSRNNFLAVECSDWETFEKGDCSSNPRVIMGYNTPTSSPHGNYFLKTGSGFEFGLGENGIV